MCGNGWQARRDKFVGLAVNSLVVSSIKQCTKAGPGGFYILCSDMAASILYPSIKFNKGRAPQKFRHPTRKSNVQKPKIKTKTETKRVKTPTRGRFAPLAQVPPLLFPFSF